MRRTEARELFMQLLFQMEMQDDYSPTQKKRFVEEHMTEGGQEDGQKEYFNRMFELTTTHLKEIDELLTDYCNRWKLERLAKVDLAVLRLSVCEILYVDDVPDSASINEAVEMAKKFGGEESGKFVNGILGRVVRGKDEKK